MKNLVYDLSHGEFRSINELYAQPITEHNVRLMGELAAVNAIRTLLPYYGEQMDRLYRALFKDIHGMNNPEYTFSDAYDVAQTAVCFLWEFKGRKVTENYGISHNKNITILTACYRVLNKYLEQFRQKILHTKQTNVSDDRHGLAAPATVRQIREEDYLKLDTIMNAMNMTERQREIIGHYMSGLTSIEIAKLVGIHHGSVRQMRIYIRKKYIACFGQY